MRAFAAVAGRDVDAGHAAAAVADLMDLGAEDELAAVGAQMPRPHGPTCDPRSPAPARNRLWPVCSWGCWMCSVVMGNGG